MQTDYSAKRYPCVSKYSFSTLVHNTPTNILEDWLEYYNNCRDQYRSDIISYELELRKVPETNNYNLNILLLILFLLILVVTGPIVL